MVAGCLSAALRRLLAAQGRFIARHPTGFFILPILVSVGMAYVLMGTVQTTKTENALELYVPKQGLSKSGRELMQQYFGDTDKSEFDPINGVSFAIILKRKDEGDILNSEFMSEYLWLRQHLEAMPVFYLGSEFTYTHLCHRNRMQPHTCMADFVKMVTLRGIQGHRDIRLMTYPNTIWAPPGLQVPIKIVVPLGGVELSYAGLIMSAKAVLMTFTFAYEHYEAAQAWENQLQLALAQFQSDNIEVTHFTMRQFQTDLASMATYLHELMPSLLLVIVVFCILSCCVADWVHSKPLMAIGGVGSTLMAIITGFGLTVLLGVPTVDIVYVSPFLMLSVGVDDMFLMLAAWRRTSVHMSVTERLAHTYGDAAVSITITSITDALSFAIGAFTVFPAVRYFCIYTAISLICTYLYQITLFGAVMAVSGYREAANRHCFFMVKLKTSLEADEGDSSSMCYRVLCTGGDGRVLDEGIYGVASSIDGVTTLQKPPLSPTPEDKERSRRLKSARCLPIKPNDNIFNLFFQRYYAPLLQHKSIKFLAAVSYLFYLLMAIYGTTTVRIGMNYAELLPDGSITSDYLLDFSHYFAHHLSAPLEVLIPTMDLSLQEHQETALTIVHQFEHGAYTGEAEYWLLDFAHFYKANHGSRQDFYLLLNEFLQVPLYAKYASHVKFDPLHRRITSRALIQTHDIAFGQERLFLGFVKDILALPQMENVTAYHSTFQLAEQQAAVLPAMIQTVGAATGAMLVVAFLLIPKPACSLCLAACIISTNLGVLGAMSLWGVRVDIISMITVLMSVGISVDFVAHVSYFYVQALQMDLPLSKAQRALRYLGLPIMQGAMSTICGMTVLLAIRAYMVRAFVKTLLLVIIFGLYHGLVLLPIVLSLFIKESSKSRPGPDQDPAKTGIKQYQLNGSGNSVFDDTIKRPNKPELEKRRQVAKSVVGKMGVGGRASSGMTVGVSRNESVTPPTTTTTAEETTSSSSDGQTVSPTRRHNNNDKQQQQQHYMAPKNSSTINHQQQQQQLQQPQQQQPQKQQQQQREYMRDLNWSLARRLLPSGKVQASEPQPNYSPSTMSRHPPEQRCADGSIFVVSNNINSKLGSMPMPSNPSKHQYSNIGFLAPDVPVPTLGQAPPVRQITRNAKVLHWLTAHPKNEQHPSYSSTKIGP